MQPHALPEVSDILPWQATPWRRMLDQLHAGRLPHALLLAGPAGSGKERLALALARRLLCSDQSADRNCGICHSCRLSRSGVHGDLLWLQPEEKSRVIKVDQIRAAVDFVGRTAGFGRYKVVVLSPAEALNTAAANALLKCLEEPAVGTFLILVCHRLHGLPATIRSRCQLLRLPQPPRDAGLDWLRREIGDAALADRLLEAVGGSPLRAERLHRAGGLERLEAVHAALAALPQGAAADVELLSLFDGTPPEQGLEEIATALERWLSAAAVSELKSAPGRAAFALLDEIRRLQLAVYGGSNPNPRLLFETLFTWLKQNLGRPAEGASIRPQPGKIA